MDQTWLNLIKLDFSPIKKCYCKNIFLDQICPKRIKLDQIQCWSQRKQKDMGEIEEILLKFFKTDVHIIQKIQVWLPNFWLWLQWCFVAFGYHNLTTKEQSLSPLFHWQIRLIFLLEIIPAPSNDLVITTGSKIYLDLLPVFHRIYRKLLSWTIG